MQVAISGGGISGLALAYRLLKESKTLRVSLIEKAPRIGGWLQTYRKREYLFEKGPRSLRVTNGSHTLELLKDLDLTPMPTSPSANSRYIFCSTNSEPSQIHELPNSFGSIFKSSLMKSMLPNMLTMQLRQALKFGKSDQSDQTIHEYFSSQFGEEFSRKFMGALCSGIFAGDPEKLSLKECFPSIESWHQNSGRTSIIAAMLLARMKVILAGSQSGKKPNVPYSSYSFQNGIEELPMKLEQEMLHRFPNRVEILKNSSILNLSEKGKADRTVLELSLNDRVLEVDHLFCSTPAYETAKLFKQTKENKYLALARLLDEIHYTDVAVINLGWLTPLDLAYQGFGYLVSPTELDENILGVSFDRELGDTSVSFPQHNHDSEQTRLTVMMGGDGIAAKNLRLDSREQLEIFATNSVMNHLNITEPPDFVYTHVNFKSIPQYYVGHGKRVQQIRELLSELFPAGPGKSKISVVGAAFNGVSINDCIRTGYEQAASFIMQNPTCQ